jgi:hypothetical protein
MNSDVIFTLKNAGGGVLKTLTRNTGTSGIATLKNSGADQFHFLTVTTNSPCTAGIVTITIPSSDIDTLGTCTSVADTECVTSNPQLTSRNCSPTGGGIADTKEHPVPTVSEWGLVALTLLGMVLGTVILQRRLPVASGAL